MADRRIAIAQQRVAEAKAAIRLGHSYDGVTHKLYRAERELSLAHLSWSFLSQAKIVLERRQ